MVAEALTIAKKRVALVDCDFTFSSGYEALEPQLKHITLDEDPIQKHKTDPVYITQTNQYLHSPFYNMNSISIYPHEKNRIKISIVDPHLRLYALVGRDLYSVFFMRVNRY